MGKRLDLIQKFRIVIMAAIMCFVFSINDYGCQASVDDLEGSLDNMTIVELNELINSIMLEEKNNCESGKMFIMQNMLITGPDPVAATRSQIKTAWKAAAKVAEKAGYPCAAKLIECAVDGEDYVENAETTYKGLFYSKIYNNWKFVNARNTSKAANGKVVSFAFEKSDNSDLFYALHKVNLTAKNRKGKITDTFDFAYDNDYDDLFTTLVNNWAWLCQQTHVLEPINVEIRFSYK